MAEVTVSNLKVAQFIYLLLNNAELRDIIGTLLSKVVLVLGSFHKGRKEVLDAIKERLATHTPAYVPVVVDFALAREKDLLSTVGLLAQMARFVVVDVTEAATVKSELMALSNITVTIKPIMLMVEAEPVHELERVWEHCRHVLRTYYYTSADSLLLNLESEVIAPAEADAQKLHWGI
jgi:hypothetical protein